MADVGWLGATDYEIGRQVLQRGVAAVAAVANWSALRQFRPLLGERGLLPVPRLLATTGPRGPSLFRRGYTDRRLVAVAAGGLVVGKPGDPSRRPRQWAPYHLRLDWLMWFLPLGRIDAPWFQALLDALLRADPGVLRLLRVDPFDGEPPRWVRAQAYHYRFATRAEHRRDGAVWTRTLQGTAIGPVRISPVRQR